MAKKSKKQNAPSSSTIFDKGLPQEPSHLLRDKGRVLVDVDGADAGTPQRFVKGEVLDASGTAEEGIIGVPFAQWMPFDGLPRRVMKAATVLDVMKRNGTIDAAHYEAGQYVERVYILSHKDVYASVKFDHVKGSVSAQDFLDCQREARARLEVIEELLGGRGAVAHTAVICIVGKGWTFSQLRMQAQRTEQFWRGALLSGLDILVQGSKKLQKNFSGKR